MVLVDLNFSVVSSSSAVGDGDVVDGADVVECTISEVVGAMLVTSGNDMFVENKSSCSSVAAST